MRFSSSLVLATLVAFGLPCDATAQLAASRASASPRASIANCQWQPIGQIPNFAPRSLAAAPDGSFLLAGDDTRNNGSVAVVLRQAPGGGSWEEVDRYLPAGTATSGVRALHVDRDGNAFLLVWEARSAQSLLTLRRSFGDGTVGTWENAETHWPLLGAGGALASDTDGRVYVAYGYGGAGGVGWRVESALRGMGAFSVEDDFRVTGVGGAVPQDLERGADGTLVLTGQLDGTPDQWVVRSRPRRADGRPAAWRTIDRYVLTDNTYGLTPRAVVATDDGRLLVSGLGVRGGGSDDYQWLDRWQSARGRWKTSTFQLATGFTSMAQDAAATRDGVAVLGVGYGPSGGALVLRETTDGGGHWQTALRLDGVTDPWSARLAVGASAAAVTASLGGTAVVLGCGR